MQKLPETTIHRGLESILKYYLMERKIIQMLLRLLVLE
jgi:hypothetical protein